jgi:hypothetical protein
MRYELAVNGLLATLGMGPGKGLDTVMEKAVRKELKQEVLERYTACLKNEEGSIEALREALDRNSKAFLDLYQAYMASLTTGSRTMLSELSPHTILDEHRRPFGHNFQEAWKTVERVHSDLANLSSEELWKRFFLEPFQAKLSEYLGGDGSGS